VHAAPIGVDHGGGEQKNGEEGAGRRAAEEAEKQ